MGPAQTAPAGFQPQEELDSRYSVTYHRAHVRLVQYAGQLQRRQAARTGLGEGEVDGREPTCKPGSVVDSHSSGMRVTAHLKRPTREQRGPRFAAEHSDTLPYLVLLRVGFTLPPTLPPARCALTAPFHPYPAPTERRRAVSFLWHWP